MQRKSDVLTISLPRPMTKQLQALQKAEHRSRSEVIREALRLYLVARTRPAYTPTSRELRAMEAGRREISRGDYYTLDEFRAATLGRPRPKVSTKNRPTRAAS